MSLASILTNVGTGALSGGAVVALIEGVFNRGGKRAEVAAKMAESAKTKAETALKDHELWRSEAAEAYDRIESECARCTVQLKRVESALWELLVDLIEIDSSDVMELRSQIRAAARRARQAAHLSDRP